MNRGHAEVGRLVFGSAGWAFAFLLMLMPRGSAQPIPEPGLLLYGVITKSDTGGTRRVVLGTLELKIQAAGGGTPIQLRTLLTNLNDQFSYVLEVPFETRTVGGQFLGASAGALELPATAASFIRGTVTFDGKAIAFVNPTQKTFVFGPRDRGRMERVDLTVVLKPIDSDRDGMDDDWERTFFGSLSRDGTGDADGDGVSDLDEFQAGTNPKDPQSVFRFIEITPSESGEIVLRWSSIEGRSYTLERSASLPTGFVPIQTGISSTPPANSFTNVTVGQREPVFFRLRVEQ